MSLAHHRGSAWAFSELMKSAQSDIDQGIAKPAKVLHRRANPAKVVIGWFAARVLRGELKRKAG